MNRNFRLRPGSPLIDAADPSVAPGNDQDRVPRPFDGDGDLVAIADIGAYEYPSGEVFDLVFTSNDTLDWEVLPEDQAFNLYRGSLSAVKTQGVYTQNPIFPIPEQFCEIPALSVPYSDVYTPTSGKTAIYLVTKVAPTFEGSLGYASDGDLRPNDYPCP